jgi:hypothetical protein
VFAVWLVVLMVDALAAHGAALVATPESGKQASDTRTWCTADVCNMKPGAFTFYSLYALRTYTCAAAIGPVFIADARAPTKGFVSLRFIAVTRFVPRAGGKVVSPFYALTRLSAPAKRNCCSAECSRNVGIGVTQM